jgi:5-methylcytosine-specific restriction endonuclease McrA
MPQRRFASPQRTRPSGINRTSDREKERKALDALLRPFVLQRAQGRCERCGQVGGAAKVGGRSSEPVALQVAHFKSRRIEHTRWHPDNVACLCKGCHFLWAHSEPDEFAAWWERRIGAKAVAELNLIWRTLRGRPRLDLTLERIGIEGLFVDLRESGGTMLRSPSA